MSVFDKIASSQIAARRKLYDYQISQAGNEVQVIHLKMTTNKYDDKEITVVSHGLKNVVLELPQELPMTRLRTSLTDEVTPTTSVFFYDILPIKVWTPFNGNIEDDDIIIQKIFMDNNEYYLVLQVTETVGNLSGRHIVWKEQYCSPYTHALTNEVQAIVNGYKSL